MHVRRPAPPPVPYSDPRIHFAGPLVGADLDAAYADADLFVLPSRAETYGMVVTEALARALPVLATDVGGVPEALGRAPRRQPSRPLVPPGDPVVLAGALAPGSPTRPCEPSGAPPPPTAAHTLPTWTATARAPTGPPIDSTEEIRDDRRVQRDLARPARARRRRRPRP